MEAALEDFIISNKLGLHLMDSETRDLHSEVEVLRQREREAIGRAEEGAEAVKVRKENLNNLRSVLQQIQALSIAHTDQIQQEKELKDAADREIRSVQQNLLNLNQQVLAIQQSKKSLQHLIILKEKEIQQLQTELSDNCELVEELVDQLGELENDNLLIQQFSEQDSSEIEALVRSLENTSKAVSCAECSLEASRHQEAAEYAVQANYAASYTSCCSRRNNLLLQWEQGLNRLQQKGLQHEATLQATLKLLDEIRQSESRDCEEVKLLEHIRRGNEGLGRKMAGTRHLEGQVDQQLAETRSTRSELEAQVAALETGIKKSGAEAEQIALQNKQDKENNKEKEILLKQLQQEAEETDQKIELNSELLEETLGSEREMTARIAQAEKDLQNAARRLEEILKHHQKMRLELQSLEDEKRTLEGEVNALKAHCYRTNKDTREMGKRIEKLKELCYKKETEVLSLKRRLHDLTRDDNNNEEEQSKRQQLRALEAYAEEATKEKGMLERHRNTLQTQLVTSSKELNRKSQELEGMERKIAVLKMDCESADRECSRLTNERDDTEVQVGLQRLHLRQRLKQVARLEKEAQELTSSRVQMKELVEEQCREVKSKMAAAELEVKKLEGEIHKASLVLHSTESQLQQMMERYSTLCQTLGVKKGEEEEEIEITAAKIIMRMEEEVSGLQEAGDMVEGEVREAEEDLRALTVLLEHAKREEDGIKRALYHTCRRGPEDEPLLKLEQEILDIEKEIEDLKGVRVQFQEELKSNEDSLHEMKLQSKVVEELFAEKTCHMNSAQRDMTEQKIKITHAKEATSSLIRKTRLQQSMQADIELRVMQERLRLVNHHLGRLGSEHPDVASFICLYCQQANIPPPKLTVAVQRRAFGARSSAGSLSSRSSLSGSEMSDHKSSSSSARSGASSVRSKDSGSSSIVTSPQHRRGNTGTKRGAPGMQTPAAEGNSTGLKEISADFPTVDAGSAPFKGKVFKPRPA